MLHGSCDGQVMDRAADWATVEQAQAVLAGLPSPNNTSDLFVTITGSRDRLPTRELRPSACLRCSRKL